MESPHDSHSWLYYGGVKVKNIAKKYLCKCILYGGNTSNGSMHVRDVWVCTSRDMLLSEALAVCTPTTQRKHAEFYTY